MRPPFSRDEVLQDCFECSAPYIDDILIFSNSWKEHLRDVQKVLGVLRKHGLTAKPSKCVWGKSYVEYLGHIVGNGTVVVPQMHVEAMAKFAQLVSRKNMRAFLGTVGYYRKFIPQFSKYSSVLTPATCQDAPAKVVWTPKMLESFHHLRSVLCSVCVLNVPTPDDVFTVETDASAGGVGGVLNVVRDGQTLPVAFFSKQLQGAERRYSATELEALAVFRTINFFAHFLYGRKFSVFTDHQALVSMRTGRAMNRRVHGWALKLQDFQFDVIYRRGAANANADGLSRQAEEVAEDGV